jgi:hypothetical protein
MRRRLFRKARMLGDPGRELKTNAWRVTLLRVKKTWRIPTAVIVVCTAAIVASFWFLPILDRVPAYIRGLIAGAACASLIAGMVWFFLATDGSMTWRVGAFGELMDFRLTPWPRTSLDCAQ